MVLIPGSWEPPIASPAARPDGIACRLQAARGAPVQGRPREDRKQRDDREVHAELAPSHEVFHEWLGLTAQGTLGRIEKEGREDGAPNQSIAAPTWTIRRTMTHQSIAAPRATGLN